MCVLEPMVANLSKSILFRWHLTSPSQHKNPMVNPSGFGGEVGGSRMGLAILRFGWYQLDN